VKKIKPLSDSAKSYILETLKKQKKESYERTRESREEALKIKKYFRGEQLPDDVIAIISGRDQPLEWENIVKKIANKIMGLKLLSKQEINVFGRQVEDMAQANVITNVLRASQDSTDFWSYKKRADKDLLLAGISIMQPVIKELGEVDLLGIKERDLRYYHLPMEQSFWDPYFTSPDGSDSRYFHHERLIDRESLYEFFDPEIIDQIPLCNNLEITDYLTSEVGYSERVKITYSWYRKYCKEKRRNVIYYAIWSDNILLAHKESPYNMNRVPISIRRVNDADSDNPAAFYSIFRDILPIQDRINFTHLRIANMLGSLKMLFEEDAVDDAEEFIEEFSLDNSIVKVKSGAISGNKIKEIKNSNDIAQLMQIIHDKRSVAEEIIGLNNEILGTSVQRLSGYAIEHRQNAGMVGLQLFIDASIQQDRDLADMGIKLIDQYVNAEQIYRMVDGFEADRLFKVNEIEKDTNGRVLFENGKPKRKNKLNIGRYDLILNSVPQTRGSIAERQANWVEIMKLFAGNANMLQSLLPRMLRDIESPVAMEVLEIMKKEEEQKANNTQGNQAEQLQAKELSLRIEKMQEEIKKLTSQANVNNATAEKIAKESNQATA
jgi:hypothetical protein